MKDMKKSMATNSSASIVNIDSLVVDLNIPGMQTETRTRRHFSIREYVSQMREKNNKACQPFASCEELPPMIVPNHKCWRCEGQVQCELVCDGYYSSIPSSGETANITMPEMQLDATIEVRLPVMQQNASPCGTKAKELSSGIEMDCTGDERASENLENEKTSGETLHMSSVPSGGERVDCNDFSQLNINEMVHPMDFHISGGPVSATDEPKGVGSFVSTRTQPIPLEENKSPSSDSERTLDGYSDLRRKPRRQRLLTDLMSDMEATSQEAPRLAHAPTPAQSSAPAWTTSPAPAPTLAQTLPPAPIPAPVLALTLAEYEISRNGKKGPTRKRKKADVEGSSSRLEVKCLGNISKKQRSARISSKRADRSSEPEKSLHMKKGKAPTEAYNDASGQMCLSLSLGSPSIAPSLGKMSIPVREEVARDLHSYSLSQIREANAKSKEAEGLMEASRQQNDQRATKTVVNSNYDDIPMDIVELMAKNQHERQLAGIEALPLYKRTNFSTGGSSSDNQKHPVDWLNKKTPSTMRILHPTALFDNENAINFSGAADPGHLRLSQLKNQLKFFAKSSKNRKYPVCASGSQPSKGATPAWLSKHKNMPFESNARSTESQYKGRTISDLKGAEKNMQQAKPVEVEVNPIRRDSSDIIPAMNLLNLMNKGTSLYSDTSRFRGRTSSGFDGNSLSRPSSSYSPGYTGNMSQRAAQSNSALPQNYEKSRYWASPMPLGVGNDGNVFNQHLCSKFVDLQSINISSSPSQVCRTLQLEECMFNENPADFSTPEAGNQFTIHGRDLKM